MRSPPRHSPPPPPPIPDPPSFRRYSQEDTRYPSHYHHHHLLSNHDQSEEDEEDDDDEEEGISKTCQSAEAARADRRKRQGVEKYVSDSSQLNLQFERRRSAGIRPDPYYQSSTSPLRYRSTPPPPPSEGPLMYSATAYVSNPGLRAAESYDISRVRSSPALSGGHPPPPPPPPAAAGRFPFHYTPHPPSGTPPTLRELDARYYYRNHLNLNFKLILI